MTVTTEMWRPVAGYEGHYEVSDQGRVRSVDRVCHDSIGRHRHLAGRPMSTHLSPNNGRHMVKLKTQQRGHRWYTVSSLVLSAFVGLRPEGMEACHNNGDATNDRLENLRWDTPSENARDRIRHGTNVMANRTHCPYGHLLLAPNLVRSNLPNRTCLACSRARAAVRKQALKGHVIDHRLAADSRYASIMEGE